MEVKKADSRAGLYRLFASFFANGTSNLPLKGPFLHTALFFLKPRTQVNGAVSLADLPALHGGKGIWSADARP
jgi:hypothetical protein